MYTFINEFLKSEWNNPLMKSEKYVDENSHRYAKHSEIPIGINAHY